MKRPPITNQKLGLDPCNQPRMQASTIQWFYDNQGSDNTPGTPVNITGTGNFRFKTEDRQDLVDANNRVPIPGAGDNYSFWAQLYMEMTVRPTSEIVNNMKFYGDGTMFDTGVDIFAAIQDPVRTSALTTGYDLATGVIGTTGDQMETGGAKHTDITSVANVNTHVTGTPRALTIGEASTQLDAVGETCNYLVLQGRVGTTASNGTKTAEVLTGRYDETG